MEKNQLKENVKKINVNKVKLLKENVNVVKDKKKLMVNVNM